MKIQPYEDNTNTNVYSKKLVDAFLDRTWEIKIKREHPQVVHSETWRNMDNILEFETVITIKDEDAEFLATYEFISWDTCIEEEIASAIAKAQVEKDMAFEEGKDTPRFELWIAKQLSRRRFPAESDGVRSEACLCNYIAKVIIDASKDKREAAGTAATMDIKTAYAEAEKSWRRGGTAREAVMPYLRKTPQEA